MKRFLLKWFLLLPLLALALWAQLVVPTSIATITGDGAKHQIASSGQARWVQVVAKGPSASTIPNVSDVIVGDSAITTNRGLALAPGSGFMFPPITIPPGGVANQYLYDLSAIYYLVATNDHITILWAK